MTVPSKRRAKSAIKRVSHKRRRWPFRILTDRFVEKGATSSTQPGPPAYLAELSDALLTKFSAERTPLGDSIAIKPYSRGDSSSNLSHGISSPTLGTLEPLLEPRSIKLSCETLKPEGQITKARYRRALFLTEEDLDEMIVWGTDICKKCGIIDDVSTLRQLRSKNLIAIVRAEEQVSLQSKEANMYIAQEIGKFRMPQNSTLGSLCLAATYFLGSGAG